MRHIALFLILIVAFFGTACDNEIVDRTADFEFETIDKETNKINLSVTIRYRLKSRLDKKLSREYGRHYKDSLFLPPISSISKEILKDYSAGELYSYKRDEIEQRLNEQSKTTFAEFDIELSAFLIRSVGLSDTLMKRFEKEYVTRFQNAMNNCSKETKGVITKIHDTVVYYEFMIENKNYESILSPEETRDKVSLRDTLVIEYACEEPRFHRVKK